MNLVVAAMRRPFTVLVALVAVALAAVFAIGRMPRDTFPDLGVPVIYVAQPYGGIDPTQMEGFVTYYYEYHFLYITGIEHVESKSIQGNALLKLQFHPGTNMAQAMAETVSYVNRARAFMPPGTVPPFVTRFDAGSVPVGDLVFSSDTRTVGEIQDAALNRVRPLFATLPGVSAPPPFGGSARTIVIHADPDRLRAYNMSPDEVVTALSAANTISPSGNVRIGDLMPIVPTNATVSNIKDLESVPIRTGSVQTVFIRDIGTVEDSADIATGYALVNGRRTVYIPVTKRADASTLSVVALVKQNLAKFQSVLPDGVTVSYQFDQSPYVTGAIDNLMIEGVIGAILTGLMVLLFLRDFRSALIVVLNIPLALLAAMVALWLTGQTVNIMTLGGLALAVGILVDEATVTIENIHTHVARGKTLARSALDATSETALPRLLAMLCILAVFTPAFFMTGAARSLFLPLSLAVGFAMVASYVLSSTFVPVLAVWVMKRRAGKEEHASGGGFARVQEGFAKGMHRVVRLRWAVLLAYLAVSALIILLVGPRLGAEIFPKVDAGQFQLRLHAPTGSRIEHTEAVLLRTLDLIKEEVGAKNIEITLAFVGIQAPSYPINTVFLWTGGPEEAVVQVQLKRGAGIGIEGLKERLRKRLAAQEPEVRYSFEPSDIVSRVMSFGSPTPVEIAVSGPALDVDQAYALRVRDALMRIQSLRDVQFGQALDYPTMRVDVDRERAGIMGLTSAEIARSTVAATSSSRFTAPNYWADPKSGIAYQVQVDVPILKMNSMEAIQNIPVSGKGGSSALLRDIATVTPGVAVGEYDRLDSQRMVTLTANVVGEDLGSAAARIDGALKRVGKPPPRVTVTVRGQIPPMRDMLGGLQTGFLVAVVVVFLLLAANFQSLRLPIVVISAAPAVVAGVVLALWLTGTTLNIQSYMGAIMAVGVAVANAILLVTFAERSRTGGATAPAAAIEGAQSRLRPILMTSLAMMAGMVPMALGLGEGGQQTAPLGRAVIGGLAAATIATLLALPSVFALLQGRATTRSASLDPTDIESAHYVQPVREGASANE
ncbi:MAG TPA: efflux RND transporter permease subunit [Chthonomonadaceae bacterium]|nr:efflux RND transporter permease subunit [Chthonomonadaceae bacterium]